MEEKLKSLLLELGNAINESLSDSDRIASAVDNIRSAGYNVFLVLEATIGFNRREDSDSETIGYDTNGPEEEQAGQTSAAEESSTHKVDSKISWTSQDEKFLKALKIATNDKNS